MYKPHIIVANENNTGRLVSCSCPCWMASSGTYKGATSTTVTWPQESNISLWWFKRQYWGRVMHIRFGKLCCQSSSFRCQAIIRTSDGASLNGRLGIIFCHEISSAKRHPFVSAYVCTRSSRRTSLYIFNIIHIFPDDKICVTCECWQTTCRYSYRLIHEPHTLLSRKTQ